MNQCVTGTVLPFLTLLSAVLVLVLREKTDKRSLDEEHCHEFDERSTALIGVINCKLDRDESKRLRKSELSRCASATDDEREFAKTDKNRLSHAK